MICKLLNVIFISCLLACTTLLYAQPKIEKLSDWSQQGYYILNPVFANNVSELAYVCQLSGRDSSVSNKSLLQGSSKNYLVGENIKNRFYDPVIVVLNYANKQYSLLDYGWSPAFSSNDNRLAYAYQQRPLQLHEKLYADAFKGNSIKVFNKIAGSVQEVVKPFNNYLLDPFFVDSLTIAYKTGNKVNGPYGAAIALNSINVTTKVKQPVRLPAIKHRQYNLIGETYLIDKKLAYITYSPVDTGNGLANQYLHLLLSGKDTLINFGINRFVNLNYKFAYKNVGEMLILDDEHLWEEDTNYVIKYHSHKVVQKTPISFKYEKAYLSPDGQHILCITVNNEAYLVNLKSMNKTIISIPAKPFHAVAWNNKGNLLALVQDHETLVGTDQLYVFRIGAVGR